MAGTEEMLFLKHWMKDFPGGPVKTSLSKAGDTSSRSHVSWPRKQNIKQKQYWNKFNKDFFKKWSTSEKKKKKRGKGVFHTEVQWEGIGTKVLHF